jgi:hypothetical protein
MRFQKNLLILIITMMAGSSAFAGSTLPANEGPRVWKAVFLTGDDSIPAFDNAREAAAEKWKNDGLTAIRQLSMDPDQASETVWASSAEGLDKALRGLRLKDDEGCLIWMTSHGNVDGLYMRDQDFLSPEVLGEILNKRCKNNPTALIISACHSGTFLSLKAPNRIIMTAARKDRKSFGCSVKYQYTFFDDCILRHYSKSKTFEGLFIRANLCIKKKESDEDASPPSMPQVYVGKQMKLLKIPRKNTNIVKKTNSKSSAQNKKPKKGKAGPG